MPGTGCAEHLLLAVEVVQRLRAEHHALGIFTVLQPQEMPDLVRPLLRDPVDHVVIRMLPAVKPVLEPGGGDNPELYPGPGNAEDKITARDEEVEGYHEQHDALRAVLACIDILDAVKDLPGIMLVPVALISPDHHGVLHDLCMDREDVGDGAGNRELEPPGRTLIPKDNDVHFQYFWVMRPYKHIEKEIAAYIFERYRDIVEIGIGTNDEVAALCAGHGCRVRATDVVPRSPDPRIRFFQDDIFSPAISLYEGCDLVYAIRPGIEMVPALISLAGILDCDCLVYHLGRELYLDGGEIIECGVVLHRYLSAQKRSKRED